MPRQPKPPTSRTVHRMVGALLRTLAVVYAKDGTFTETKTTHMGTLFVTWRSGARVLEDGDKPREGEGVCHD